MTYSNIFGCLIFALFSARLNAFTFQNVCTDSGGTAKCQLGSSIQGKGGPVQSYCCAEGRLFQVNFDSFYCKESQFTCEDKGLVTIPNSAAGSPTAAPIAVANSPTPAPIAANSPTIAPTGSAPLYRTCCPSSNILGTGVCANRPITVDVTGFQMSFFCCEDGSGPTINNHECFCGTSSTCSENKSGVVMANACRGSGCSSQNSNYEYKYGFVEEAGVLCCPDTNTMVQHSYTSNFLKASCPVSGNSCPAGTEPFSMDYISSTSQSTSTVITSSSSSSSSSGISTGAIVGIVVAIALLCACGVSIGVYQVLQADKRTHQEVVEAGIGSGV